MMLQVGDDGVVSSVNEEDLIYVDKNELEQFVESYHQLEKENEQLKKQMQRLYNYFADWFDDRVPPSDFSEMWDFVKEDEKWD